MREQKAITDANSTAAKNMAEEVMKTLKESRAITKQAEEEKQRALTALVEDDYLNKPQQDALPPLKHVFLINCEFLGGTSIKMSMEGLSYVHDIKPNMREKIINTFVSMGDILYDTEFKSC